jgi:outer membrane usher protein
MAAARVRGEAAVPTSVDLFINGYRSGSTQLQPGPFTLTNLPYINGAGDAVLVTTDALGRQVSTTLPFYVTSDLLKQGLSDGAVTLGSLRRNYGIKNFDYGPAAGSGSYRYGVTDWLTLEGHAEGAQELALGGAGTVIKLGQFGVVNTSYSQSRMRGMRAGKSTGVTSTAPASSAWPPSTRVATAALAIWPFTTSRRCMTKTINPSPALAAIRTSIP